MRSRTPWEKKMPTFASLSRRIVSTTSIWLVSLASGICVLGFAAFLQWLIYDDWMHERGSLQLFGISLAALLTFLSVLRWQIAIRRRRLEMIRQFETIEWMNDRIRNALQSIDLIAFAHSAGAEQVRIAVDAIDVVLKEVLEGSHPHKAAQRQPAKQQVLQTSRVIPR
jgi:hypothetical protein